MNKTILNLSKYSAVACSILMVNATKAEVIYTDVDPDSVLILANGDVFELDFNKDGNTDYSFKIQTISGVDELVHADLAVVRLHGNQLIGSFYTHTTDYLPSTYQGLLAMAFESTIDITRSFADGSSLFPGTQGSGNMGELGYFKTYSNLVYSSDESAWVMEKTYNRGGVFTDIAGYLGCKFLIGTETHYGWINIAVSLKVDQTLIFKYAYEAIADKGIKSGQTSSVGIKEQQNRPTVYSYGRNIHIISQGKGTAVVYNIAGQEIARTYLKGGNEKINVTESVGIHMIKISGNGKASSHKVQLN
ncbi:MAG: T9SS type A sorting domain-containing protein [Flavobacteriales bacterium]|nr:T9SS type A sorting domain-containing protein [Flavobacteriales bacterium]